MNEEKKNKEPLFITIIVLMGLMLAGIGYDWYVKGNNLESCTTSNDLMTAELEELNQIMIGGDIDLMADNIKDNLRGMLSEYDSMSTDNAALSDSISKEKQKIEGLSQIMLVHCKQYHPRYVLNRPLSPKQVVLSS